MAKQKEGVYDKILECAKKEFLEKGFNLASLRIIAQNANTSTCSIYTRFVDKEGLFEALVIPVISDLKKWFLEEQNTFHNLPDFTQENTLLVIEHKYIDFFIDYIYDNFDIFKLLITCSEGTKFSKLIDDLATIDVEYTAKFLKITNNSKFSCNKTSKELIHIITSSYYTGLFETVTHNMTRENAHIYSHRLTRFFMCGWKDLLGM